MAATARSAALVLAGGGANGAFQAGAERVLREMHGYSWDAVYGVSAGALNAILIGQQRYDELHRLWSEDAAGLVRRRRPWRILPVVFGTKGFYDNAQLRKLVTRLVAEAPFVVPVRVGFVDMGYGEYATVDNTAPNFADLAIASTSIPVAFDQPVGPSGRPLGDGGMRNMAPVKDAVFDGHDEIVVILNRAVTLKPKSEIKGLMARISRAMDIMLSEIAQNDIESVGYVNALVAAGAAPDKRTVKMTVVRPSRDLGESMDFSLKHTREAIMQGEMDATRL